MRAFLVILALAASGCVFPGLGSSPTKCPVSHAVDDGFLITLEDPDVFVGYCVEISLRGDSIDEPFTARKVPVDGSVYLPVTGPGSYYLKIQVEDPDDNYCAFSAHAFEEHTGSGLTEVLMEVGKVCA